MLLIFVNIIYVLSLNFVNARRAKSNRAGRWLGIGMGHRDELQLVVDALNGKYIYREENGEDLGDYDEIHRDTPAILRELVEAWQWSGPDLAKFHRDNPMTWAAAAEFWKRNPPLLWYTPGSGGADLIGSPTPGITPSQEAVRFLLMLILNPEWERLAGPCTRCGNYYIRRSARNKVYCSRSCGTRATALAATKRKREEERAEKLRRVVQLSQKWITARTKQDWKSWICEQRDITRSFLTRAGNNGDLKVPKKPKKEGK